MSTILNVVKNVLKHFQCVNESKFCQTFSTMSNILNNVEHSQQCRTFSTMSNILNIVEHSQHSQHCWTFSTLLNILNIVEHSQHVDQSKFCRTFLSLSNILYLKSMLFRNYVTKTKQWNGQQNKENYSKLIFILFFEF